MKTFLTYATTLTLFGAIACLSVLVGVTVESILVGVATNILLSMGMLLALGYHNER